MKNLREFDIFSFLLLFITMLSYNAHNTYAVTSYNQTGNYNGYFQNGRNFFADPSLNPTIGLVGLTDGRFLPFVSDLDGDGIQEIIVADDISINLYHGSSLTPVNAYTIGSQDTSLPIAYDIDNDGKTEILIADNDNRKLLILEYNGTSFYNQTSMEYFHIGGEGQDGDQVIQCRAVEDCIIIYTDKEADTATTGDIFANVFNSTHVYNRSNIDNTVSQGSYCFPTINHATASDYDADADVEYIFSATITTSATIADTQVYALSINSNHTAIKELEILDTTPAFSGVLDGNCANANNIWSITTAPLVADIDGLPNQQEIVIGMSKNSAEYIIRAYTKTGSVFDTYPFSVDGNGRIISNLFEAYHDALDLNGGFQFCGIGFNDLTNDSEMICVNEGASVETTIFSYNPPGNIIEPHPLEVFTNVGHSVQTSTQSPDTDEILFINGIYHFDFSDILCTSALKEAGFCTAEIDYSIQGNQSWIANDVQRTGKEDLIGVSSSFLFYIDDGFTNSPTEITSYSVNPCLDSVWKQNTSVQVTITSTDPDADLVSSRAVLYLGDSNEQDSGFSNNVTSGQPVIFNFVANKTIGLGSLNLYSKDQVNQLVDTIPLTFSVSTNGVSFGDCQTNVNVQTQQQQQNATQGVITTISSNNAITSGVGSIASNFGLSSLIIWLLIMFLVAIALFWVGMQEFHISGSATLTLIGFVETLLLIVGALLGFISIGIIVLIAVVSVVAIGLYLRKAVTGA